MNKLPLSLGLLLTFASLVIAPIKANAGVVVTPGTTPDSSNFSGTNFVPTNTVPQPAPDTNVSVGETGQISAPPAVQNNVNNTAGNFVNPPGGPVTQQSLVIIIILQGSGSQTAANTIVNLWTSFGVSTGNIQALITALRSLLKNKSAATPGLPVAQLAPGQLVASTKGFAARSVIAQNSAKPNVDLNKLNDAINAYNKIVLESSPETLVKLSKDPEFLQTGKFLRELRTSLNK